MSFDPTGEARTADIALSSVIKKRKSKVPTTQKVNRKTLARHQLALHEANEWAAHDPHAARSEQQQSRRAVERARQQAALQPQRKQPHGIYAEADDRPGHRGGRDFLDAGIGPPVYEGSRGQENRSASAMNRASNWT